MLRKVLVLLTISLFLVGCRPISIIETTKTKDYSILSYYGTPSLSLLAITNDNYDIKITNTTDSIKFSMEKGDKDFVIAPIDAGVKYAQDFGKYKLLSIVEYGTLALSCSNEESTNYLVGAYGKDSIVGNIVNFLNDTTFVDFELTWYNNLDELTNALQNRDIDFVIVDEVNFNNFNNYLGIEMTRIRDLKDDYEILTGLNRYPMYGLFVLNDTLKYYQNDVVNFSKKIANSISTYKNDKTTFNQVLANADIEKMGFSNPKLISESYNYCGLEYIYANKDLKSLKSVLDICNIELDEKIIVQ